MYIADNRGRNYCRGRIVLSMVKVVVAVEVQDKKFGLLFTCEWTAQLRDPARRGTKATQTNAPRYHEITENNSKDQ